MMMKTMKKNPNEDDDKDEYDIVTICFDEESRPVIVPGRVNIGDNIIYDDGSRATAERKVNLPLRMDEEMMHQWIQEQMSRKGSMLRRKVEEVMPDGR